MTQRKSINKVESDEAPQNLKMAAIAMGKKKTVKRKIDFSKEVRQSNNNATKARKLITTQNVSADESNENKSDKLKGNQF